MGSGVGGDSDDAVSVQCLPRVRAAHLIESPKDPVSVHKLFPYDFVISLPLYNTES